MPCLDLVATFPRQSPLNGLTLREPIDENKLNHSCPKIEKSL